jgi:glycosyltransferase involved in cell wall biosynthesis
MIDRLVLASPGAWQAPSARYRLGPLRDAAIWPIEAISAGSRPTSTTVEAMLELGGKRAALLLHRALPSPADLERLRSRYARLIFDFDDAIYTVPPDLSQSGVRQFPKRAARLALRGSPYASARKRPLERLLRGVDACVAGNRILGDYARRFARRVIEIPTTIDPVPALPTFREEPPVIVWMGLPDNLQHLELVAGALERLALDVEFRFRVVSTRSWEDAPVPVQFVAWSEDTLAENLMSASVGVAPLKDDPWTRGKCAFRAIQYGGHALPTVASPVGITHRVVLDGKTGYLASTTDVWERALRSLLTDPVLVARMADAAVHHIGKNYSNDVALDAWRSLINSLDH